AVAAGPFGVVSETGWRNLWRVLLPVAAVAFTVMLVCWPWAQRDPIDNPLRALSSSSHDTSPFNTLCAALFVRASALPWEYLPTYLLLALPELVLVLLVAAA